MKQCEIVSKPMDGWSSMFLAFCSARNANTIFTNFKTFVTDVLNFLYNKSKENLDFCHQT